MIILGTNSIKDTGFDVANSCRFNEASADSLHRATGETTGATNWTLSTWIKRSTLGSLTNGGTFMGWYSATNKRSVFGFNDSDKLYWWSDNGSGTQGDATTAAVFRDVSAWYHVVLRIDTTQSSQSDRVKIYVNNVEQSLTFSGSHPTQNEANTGMYGASYIGSSFYNTATDRHFGGYLAETVMIDDASLNPDQFGEFDSDSGIWKPIDVSGLTFGSDGFYCDYEDSSALGNDAAGSNNLTVTNLTSIDQSTDTCTNNSSNINALSIGDGVTLSEGNLQVLMDASAQFGGHSTIGVSTGKWYCEIKYSARTDADRLMLGISGNPNLLAYASPFGSGAGYVGGAQEPTSYGYYSDGGNSFNNDNSSSYGASYTVGDIIGIALDLDNNKLYFSKNGTFQNSGNPTSGSTGTGAISIGAASGTNTGNYFFAVSESSGSYGHTTQCNFGSPPYAISSGNTDGNGYGNFEYAVPSGYYSLNTKNLSEFG